MINHPSDTDCEGPGRAPNTLFWGVGIYNNVVHPPPAAQVLRCILEAAAAGPYVWFTDKSWTREWKQDYRLDQKWIFVDREGNWVSPMSWHYDVARRIWSSWVLLRGMWFCTSCDSLTLGYCHGRIWKNTSRPRTTSDILTNTPSIFMPTKNYIWYPNGNFWWQISYTV
jgi:hypothetical protein